MNVRICVVTFRSAESATRLLEFLRVQYPSWELCLWDNYSEESCRLRAAVEDRRLADHAIWSSSNVGFARGVNGLAAIRGNWEFLLLVNPDVVLVEDVRDLFQLFEYPRTAVVGARATAPDGVVSRTEFRDLGPFGLAVRSVCGERQRPKSLVSENHTVDGWLEGSLLAISRHAWEDVGAFDERFFLYSEEQDWQRRARRCGWHVRQLPRVVYSHEGRGSARGEVGLIAKSVEWEELSRRRYIRKWWGPFGVAIYVACVGVGSAAKRLLGKGPYRASGKPSP